MRLRLSKFSFPSSLCRGTLYPPGSLGECSSKTVYPRHSRYLLHSIRRPRVAEIDCKDPETGSMDVPFPKGKAAKRKPNRSPFGSGNKAAPTQKISGRRKIGPSQPIVRGLFARLPGAKKGFWLNRRIKGKSSGLMGENLLLSGRCSTFLAVGENSGKALGFNGEKPSSYLGAALRHFGCSSSGWFVQGLVHLMAEGLVFLSFVLHFIWVCTRPGPSNGAEYTGAPRPSKRNAAGLCAGISRGCAGISRGCARITRGYAGITRGYAI